MRHGWWVWLILACDDGGPAPAPADMAPIDATPVDARPADQGVDAAPPLDEGVDMAPAPDAATPDAEIADAAPDAGPLPCDPPLSIEPAEAWRGALDPLTFEVGGGTGAYRFSVADNASGALVHPIFGDYVAGPILGDDLIEVVDLGCVGAARASVHVVPDLEVLPTEIEIGPEEAIEFEFRGGSGVAVFTLTSNESGGAIDERGRYRAGEASGLDRVEAFDPRTELRGVADIRIVEAPRFSVTPIRAAVPVDGAVVFTPTGGSGHLSFEAPGGLLEFEPPVARGVAPGVVRLTVRDRFTGRSQVVPVIVAAAIPATVQRQGRRQRNAVLHNPGDLTGDGLPEVLLALPEGGVEFDRQGALFVYGGGAAGPEAAPIQALFGRSRFEELGRGVATVDLDDDGRLDLVVSAWLGDGNGNDSGRVAVHRAGPDGLFAAEPDFELFGARGGDRLGGSLAVCDFDGDGRADLAVGASGHDDPETGVPDTGGLFVYRGVPGGFEPEPARVVAGRLRRLDAEPVAVRGLVMGQWALAAGDLDGDGACDLAVGLPNHSAAGGRRDDGAVFIYRGQADGLISPEPARVIQAVSGNASLFGRRLAIADLDGDGRAELAVGQHGYDQPEDGNNHGAIRVFAGGPLDVRPAVLDTDADWSAIGSRDDQLGIGVFADADHLVAGAWLDEDDGEGALSNSGAVWTWPTGPGALLVDEATRIFAPAADLLFGEAVTRVGERWLVMAARDGALGPEVGRPFVVGAEAPRALDLPGAAVGARIGQALAFVDDGVALGAPTFVTPSGAQGQVEIFSRADQDADRTVADFSLHHGGDALGRRLGSGDFDGDGFDDLAIGMAGEDPPGALDPAIFALDGDCPPRPRDTGAVVILRGGPNGPGDIAWIVFGPENRAFFERSAFVDLDGDGRDDLLAGAHGWWSGGVRETGGFQVFRGRAAADDGRIRVLCDPVAELRGAVNRGFMALGLSEGVDVDGDGCLDVAVGEPGAGGNERGQVHVLYGWGGPGCPAAPTRTTFALPDAERARDRARLGWSVALGDLDGDGRPELAAGGVDHFGAGNQRPGAVIVARGAWLAAQARSPLAEPPLAVPFGDEALPAWRLSGRTNGERFGQQVSVGAGRLVVSHLFRQLDAERQRIGGADVFRLVEAAFELEGEIFGETWRRESLIGEAMALRGARVLIGGWQASGLAPDAGAAYLFDLDGWMR